MSDLSYGPLRDYRVDHADRGKDRSFHPALATPRPAGQPAAALRFVSPPGSAPQPQGDRGGPYSRDGRVARGYGANAWGMHGAASVVGALNRHVSNGQVTSAVSGPPKQLSVVGCSDGVVGPIIRGSYTLQPESHGKPVYRRESAKGDREVMIYFWADRNNSGLTGWWFGPKIGGNQVWAFNPDPTGERPPGNGWKVPFDGSVDTSLDVRLGSGSAPGGEGRTKKQKEEAQREQHAVLAIRRLLTRVRMAKPENINELTAELKEVLAREAAGAGNQEAKIRDEAEKALAQARTRVGQIKERLLQLEGQKEQADLKRRDREESRKETIAELVRLIEAGDAATEVLRGTEQRLLECTELQDEEIAAASAGISEAELDAQRAHEACLEFLRQNRSVVEPMGVRSISTTLNAAAAVSGVAAPLLETPGAFDGVVLACRAEAQPRGRSFAVAGAKRAQEVAARRCVAQRVELERKSIFHRYDADGDGLLSRQEVVDYAMGEFNFAPSGDVVDCIFSKLVSVGSKGVSLDWFQDLKVKIGVERELCRDARRRVAAQERRRLIDGKREELKKRLGVISMAIDAAHGSVNAVEEAAKEVTPETSEGVDARVATVRAELRAVGRRLEAIETEDVEEELGHFLKQEGLKMSTIAGRLDERLSQVGSIVAAARSGPSEKAASA